MRALMRELQGIELVGGAMIRSAKASFSTFSFSKVGPAEGPFLWEQAPYIWKAQPSTGGPRGVGIGPQVLPCEGEEWLASM